MKIIDESEVFSAWNFTIDRKFVDDLTDGATAENFTYLPNNTAALSLPNAGFTTTTQNGKIAPRMPKSTTTKNAA